jgi:hypothetical protein
MLQRNISLLKAQATERKSVSEREIGVGANFVILV